MYDRLGRIGNLKPADTFSRLPSHSSRAEIASTPNDGALDRYEPPAGGSALNSPQANISTSGQDFNSFPVISDTDTTTASGLIPITFATLSPPGLQYCHVPGDGTHCDNKENNFGQQCVPFRCQQSLTARPNDLAIPAEKVDTKPELTAISGKETVYPEEEYDSEEEWDQRGAAADEGSKGSPTSTGRGSPNRLVLGVVSDNASLVDKSPSVSAIGEEQPHHSVSPTVDFIEVNSGSSSPCSTQILLIQPEDTYPGAVVDLTASSDDDQPAVVLVEEDADNSVEHIDNDDVNSTGISVHGAPSLSCLSPAAQAVNDNELEVTCGDRPPDTNENSGVVEHVHTDGTPSSLMTGMPLFNQSSDTPSRPLLTAAMSAVTQATDTLRQPPAKKFCHASSSHSPSPTELNPTMAVAAGRISPIPPPLIMHAGGWLTGSSSSMMPQTAGVHPDFCGASEFSDGAASVPSTNVLGCLQPTVTMSNTEGASSPQDHELLAPLIRATNASQHLVEPTSAPSQPTSAPSQPTSAQSQSTAQPQHAQLFPNANCEQSATVQSVTVPANAASDQYVANLTDQDTTAMFNALMPVDGLTLQHCLHAPQQNILNLNPFQNADFGLQQQIQLQQQRIQLQQQQQQHPQQLDQLRLQQQQQQIDEDEHQLYRQLQQDLDDPQSVQFANTQQQGQQWMIGQMQRFHQFYQKIPRFQHMDRGTMPMFDLPQPLQTAASNFGTPFAGCIMRPQMQPGELLAVRPTLPAPAGVTASTATPPSVYTSRDALAEIQQLSDAAPVSSNQIHPPVTQPGVAATLHPTNYSSGIPLGQPVHAELVAAEPNAAIAPLHPVVPMAGFDDLPLPALATAQSPGSLPSDDTSSVPSPAATASEPPVETEEEKGQAQCVICMETIESMRKTVPIVSTKCGHVFCEPCLLKSLKLNKNCPTCRTRLQRKTAYHRIFLG